MGVAVENEVDLMIELYGRRFDLPPTVCGRIRVIARGGYGCSKGYKYHMIGHDTEIEGLPPIVYAKQNAESGTYSIMALSGNRLDISEELFHSIWPQETE